jgi:AraC-like DNA-binding protein
MVCARCIKTVTGIFQQAGVAFDKAGLGLIELPEDLKKEKLSSIKLLLEEEGFEIIDDKKVRLVEEIKKIIIELVQYGEIDEMKENLSVHLSRLLQKDYAYLSNLFSSTENTTIEQYFILQKIEKIKEWLVYGEMTLSEMSLKLGYSSVAHLSGQFKKITGFTPSQFKQLKDHNRKYLDKV